MADESYAIPDCLFWETRGAECEDDLFFLDSTEVGLDGRIVIVSPYDGVEIGVESVA